MTVLDTHIWVWWVQDDPLLKSPMKGYLEVNEKHGFGVSVISCLEVARLVNHGRLTLPRPLDEWIDTALHYPHIKLLDLTPQIAVASTQLPGRFIKIRMTVSLSRQLERWAGHWRRKTS